MKKKICLLLSVVMLLTLCSCSKESAVDESGKTLVNIASIRDDFELEQYINAFNAQSEEYFIKNKTYADFSEDMGTAANRLQLEIVSGRTYPDIIANGGISGLFSEASFDSYADKGLLEDLYVLIDNDPGVQRKDYLPNILSAFESGGELTKISPEFGITTIVGKTSDVGLYPGWSLGEFEQYLMSKEKYEYIIGSFDGRLFAKNMTERLFYNYKTGEINFDREVFFKLLRLCESFPKQDPAMVYDDLFREGASYGNPLMFTADVVNFRMVRELERLFFGEPVTFKGFPASENGSFITVTLWLSVMKNAPQKEGAWEFIKFVLDNPDTITSDRFPIKRTLLEEMAAEAKENPKDENGKRLPKEYTVDKRIPGSSGKLRDPDARYIEVAIGNNTDEDNAKVMDILTSVNRVMNIDSALKNIIAEEIDAYFNGGKSADETAELIENRLNIYLAEKG